MILAYSQCIYLDCISRYNKGSAVLIGGRHARTKCQIGCRLSLTKPIFVRVRVHDTPSGVTLKVFLAEGIIWVVVLRGPMRNWMPDLLNGLLTECKS